MNVFHRISPLLLSCPLLICLLAGCQHSRQMQLERVAKDWCGTIRASQVIPVYPLTEDVEPGDIFLVQSSIPDQRKLYQSRGYLPFETHLGRLNPTNYQQFYRSGYGMTDDSFPPRHWQFPEALSWTNAPLAGFPTYTFKVKNKAGLNAAFPISGIPVGMGLANASAAEGSVTLTETHTYGLDEATLEEAFAAWRRRHRELLAKHATRKDYPQFLRVVTRVYVVRNVDVSLQHEGSTSGGVTAGAGKPIDLATADGAEAVSNLQNSIAALNKLLNTTATSLPGGALSVAAVSSRTISLKETFPRPVVIGYLAQEYMILENGDLGPSLSTREILESRVADPVAATDRAIRHEQAEAGKIAARIIELLNESPTQESLVAAVKKAQDLKVLAGDAPKSVLEHASRDLKAGQTEFKNLLFDYAGGGSLANRWALYQLLEFVSTQHP